MNLRDILKLMLKGESGDRNIKLNLYNANRVERIAYDGRLKDLVSYMETHDNLNQCDGFPIQVQNIYKWEVVEIAIDRTRREEDNLPDYNKGKIITIM